MKTPGRGSLDVDRRLQRGRLPRDARAARLAGRAPSARTRRGPSRPSRRPADEDRQKTDAEREALRQALTGGRGARRSVALARRRAARVSPARGAARVVVVLRALRQMTDGRAARGRAKRSAASSRRARRAPDKRSLDSHASRFRRSSTSWRRATQPCDPATARGAGTIVAHRRDGGHAAASARSEPREVPLPRRSSRRRSVRHAAQRAALARLASSVLAGDGRYRALRDILARTPPRIRGRAPGGDDPDHRPRRAARADARRSTRATSSSRGRPAPARRGRARGSSPTSSAAAGASA